jgi:ATP-dependent exoDNAse (exonuclease V) beta subunit
VDQAQDVSVAQLKFLASMAHRGCRTDCSSACDYTVIPLQQRIEPVVEASDLEEAYNTGPHLLYVACTRARDQLYVSGTPPVSGFLDDLRTKSKNTKLNPE